MTGKHQLNVEQSDQLATDGSILYYLRKGHGLYKLGIGDGSSKISGYVKEFNGSDEIKSMEPCAMMLLDGKLYIRDYCKNDTPFWVYDAHTLKLDATLNTKWQQHFETIA